MGSCSNGDSRYKDSEKKYGRFSSQESKNTRRNTYQFVLTSHISRIETPSVCHARPNTTSPQRSSETPQPDPHRRATRQRTCCEDCPRSSCQDAQGFSARLSSLRLSSSSGAFEA